MAYDIVVVGAGPAGAVAATIAARAGARVLLLDRETFPRDKLCGDSVNPGTLAMLRRLGLSADIERLGRRVDGMVVTGESGVAVAGRYPPGVCGRSLGRRDLDWALLQAAMQAGAAFDPGVAVRGPLIEDTAKGRLVAGVAGGRRAGAAGAWRAPVTIAADGRRSALAFALGLAAHPARPRRWAIGAYFEHQGAVPPFGEMHVRRGRYIGVAMVPGNLVNVCLVLSDVGAGDLRDPAGVLRRALEQEPALGSRLAGLRPVRAPMVLGPLAVDATGRAIDGLLLAGDAAGFIDPMTGDGLRFAVRGGELAAHAALRVLDRGWSGVHASLASARRREFAAKWRFNRTVRRLVASPLALRVADRGARVAPGAVRAAILYAGDCSARPPASVHPDGGAA